MKKLVLSLAVATTLFTISCNNTPDAHKSEASDAVTVNDATADASSNYNVNATESKIEWLGSKPVGGSHNGIINIKTGTISTNEKGEILNGSFIIDMNSIQVLDIKEADKNAKLQGHLKDTDFFETAKYPEGKFEITGVSVASDADKLKLKDATHVISGNLTLKGVTKNLSFPAKITMTDTGMETVTDFNIDRTVWNITYNSDPVSDNFINKDINIKMNIKATKG